VGQRFYVTTPIYYITSTPHIGNAYTSIVADVLRRYHAAGAGSFMLTGTDEHGAKVAEAAARGGAEPQAWADRLVLDWRRLLEVYDVRADDFIRTTEPRHESAAVAVFERLKAGGDIYLGKYEGWYCTNDETFWLESKLVDGRCPNPECRRAVQWISEENWFFALSKYRDRLLTYFREHPAFVRPERAYNEMIATIEGGLEDLCISRTKVDWGIPLPDGSVMYVWFDALLNYITAIGWERGSPLFAQLWPADVQLIGKEIARFHTIIWPAMLWSLGLEAPKLVFAHGWMTIEGEKMSKSKGNVIDPFELAAKYGPDAVRYFLLREAPFGSDFSFSAEKLESRYNADLANDLGNLLRRSLSMLDRYRGGAVPARPEASLLGPSFDGLGGELAAAFAALDFRSALERAWELARALNVLVDDRRPWDLHKRGDDRALDAVLYELCDGLRRLAVALEPVLPRAAQSMWTQLGLEGTPSRPWDDALAFGGLEPGTQTRQAEQSLFPRLEAPAPN
jgi:methionyl-tRNA synthetase